ncbi:MAG: hypothetical protein IPP71_07760 [Bacteroidetes bacterium]|nr:hypothetical protein [Bacteroidota bacterium]
MKKLISLAILTCLMVSCSVDVQKRHYRSGYHISISKKYSPHKKSNPTKEELTFLQNKSKSISSFSAATPAQLDIQKAHYPVLSHHGQLTDVNNIKTGLNSEFSNSPDLRSPLTHLQQKNFKNKTSAPSNRISNHSHPNKKQHDSWFLAFAGAIALLLNFTFKPFIPRTRKIGYWSLNNRKVARGLHFIAHTLLAGCGLFIGKQLHELGILTSDVTTFSLAAFTSLVALLYPVRKHKSGLFKNTYAKQKLFALTMVLCGFSLFINIGDRYAENDWKYGIGVSSNRQIANATFSSTSSSISQTYHQQDKTKEVVLTVVTCLVSLLLTFLIAAGSCGLACSGQEGLSVVVLVIGIPALILGTVAVVKSIWKPKKVVTVN